MCGVAGPLGTARMPPRQAADTSETSPADRQDWQRDGDQEASDRYRLTTNAILAA
jgi:hypothetical protein